MEKYSAPFIRIGISLVVLWFGSQQILHPLIWTSLLPSWTTMFGLTPITLIYINGFIEITLGLLLVLGIWTRAVAILVALHLFEIAYTVGYGAISVRDTGLAISAVGIFLHGRDKWSFM